MTIKHFFAWLQFILAFHTLIFLIIKYSRLNRARFIYVKFYIKFVDDKKIREFVRLSNIRDYIKINFTFCSKFILINIEKRKRKKSKKKVENKD